MARGTLATDHLELFAGAVGEVGSAGFPPGSSPTALGAGNDVSAVVAVIFSLEISFRVFVVGFRPVFPPRKRPHHILPFVHRKKDSRGSAPIPVRNTPVRQRVAHFNGKFSLSVDAERRDPTPAATATETIFASEVAAQSKSSNHQPSGTSPSLPSSEREEFQGGPASKLEEYVERFTNLSGIDKSHGREAPHQPCLLMALIDLVDEGLTNCRVDFALLKPHFFKHFKENESEESFRMPFRHLGAQDSGDRRFWHLQAKPGRAGELEPRKSLRYGRFHEVVSHAIIDKELLELLRDASCREALRKALLERYKSAFETSAAPCEESSWPNLDQLREMDTIRLRETLPALLFEALEHKHKTTCDEPLLDFGAVNIWENRTVCVAFKRKNPIQRDDLETLHQLMVKESAREGVFITTERFSKEAEDYAKGAFESGSFIETVDGEELEEIIADVSSDDAIVAHGRSAGLSGLHRT